MISTLSFSPYKADFRPFIPLSQIKGVGRQLNGASPCPPLISLSFVCHASKCLMPLPGDSSNRSNKHVQKRWHISTNTASSSSPSSSPGREGEKEKNKPRQTVWNWGWIKFFFHWKPEGYFLIFCFVCLHRSPHCSTPARPPSFSSPSVRFSIQTTFRLSKKNTKIMTHWHIRHVIFTAILYVTFPNLEICAINFDQIPDLF